MTTIKILLAIGFVTLAASPAVSAEERFRPGQWEIIFTGENPHTSTICLTAAMTQGLNGTAENVRADTEKTAAARKFTVEGYKFDGTTLSYTAVGAERTFVNQASYHGDTFESLIITKAVEKNTRHVRRVDGSVPVRSFVNGRAKRAAAAGSCY